ncbi:MAG: alpha-(1-_3)-arabinofuranosyltransferase family protein [Acidimicrobiia bacterium]
MLGRMLRRLVARADVALLVALAYVPTLASSPGKMPSDTKLYLYLDPGRLVADAPWSWDTRQFGGWVPHQTISYLWPSGPWYWLLDTLGVPVWIAHRLWLGTLLVAGGLGVRWLSRRLGLPVTGALVAALCYQLSPYVLPYVSRTSLMLLPWAGLGWLIGLTLLAAQRGGWRHPAIIALVLGTVGAPNATAILMIAPGPVLWLLHATLQRDIAWRRAVATALRIGALALLTAVWWMSMLSVQGRYGADVLGYSESLEAVSATARAPETIRGMGYWLAYVRDPFAATTTAALDYMSSVGLIVTSFALVTFGVAGLAITRWSNRRFAAALVLVGTVLAVGVYPIDDPSPLMSMLASNSRSAPALALRSSTRALPLSALGLALGAGAVVVAIGGWLRGRRGRAPRFAAVPAALVGVLAVVNLPVVWTAGFVDPALARDDEPPRSWVDAAAALDARTPGYRALQLPGTEFGAYRWGYTVDPPLPGLTERPLLTRDLLPLGTPALMDTLFALDDRFQQGIVEPASIAPLARLLGAETIVVTGDVAFDRFRTPRPELTSALFAGGIPGLDDPVPYGTPAVNDPDVPMVDEQSLSVGEIGTPVAPIEIVPVEDPVPIIRAATRSVLVAGSGDGLVDAAAAGLIDGTEAIRVMAALSPDELRSAAADASLLIVTDSNRRRAHQWRGSQDVVGFTEDDDLTRPDLLRTDPADQRLPVFPADSTWAETVAVQSGPVRARATAYGEPFAYRPEDRAANAIDADLSTAWRVADRADPTGEAIELTLAEPVGTLELVQPLDATTNRWITGLTVGVDGGPPVPVVLDETSRTDIGQTVALPSAGQVIRLTITTIGEDRTTLPDGPDAVGFAEIRTGLPPTEELVRLPAGLPVAGSPDRPLAVVMTRLRTRATDRWRSDPEPRLLREFALPSQRHIAADVTARLAMRAPDDVLATVLGIAGPTASDRLTGVPTAAGWAVADGDATTSWTSPFGLAVGASLLLPVSSVAAGDQLTLQQLVDGVHGTISEVEITPGAGGEGVRVAVPPPDAQGTSSLAMPFAAEGALRVTVTATDEALTRDRRYGEPTPLPVAISEVELPGLVPIVLPERFDTGCRDDLLTIDGEPLPVTVSGSVAAALANGDVDVSVCDATPLALTAGTHVVRSAAGRVTGIDIDRVVLRSPGADGADGADGAGGAPASAAERREPVIPVDVTSSRTGRDITVGACPDGCWLVFGEGYNTGWSADLDGGSLGEPEQLAGGLNGWWLPPADTQRTVSLAWTPQRTVTVGLTLSALGVLLCAGIIVRTRRRRFVPRPADRPLLVARQHPVPRRDALVVGAIATVSSALVVDISAGVAVLVAGAVLCGLLRRPRLLGVLATATVAVAGAIIARRVVLYDQPPGFDWLQNVTDLHRPVLVAVVALAAAAFPREAGSGGGEIPSRPSG